MAIRGSSGSIQSMILVMHGLELLRLLILLIPPTSYHFKNTTLLFFLTTQRVILSLLYTQIFSTDPDGVPGYNGQQVVARAPCPRLSLRLSYPPPTPAQWSCAQAPLSRQFNVIHMKNVYWNDHNRAQAPCQILKARTTRESQIDTARLG